MSISHSYFVRSVGNRDVYQGNVYETKPCCPQSNNELNNQLDITSILQATNAT